MFNWRLVAGDLSASGWGANAAECLAGAMAQLEKAPGDSTVLPLSFHVMGPAEAKPKPKPLRAKLVGPWPAVATRFINQAKKPFYRRDLQAYLKREGFTISDDELANFLQGRKRAGAIHKHGRSRWARHP